MENRLFVMGGDMPAAQEPAAPLDLTQIEQQLSSINAALWALVAVIAPQAQPQAPVAAAAVHLPVAGAGGDWRSAVPAELYERLRNRRVETARTETMPAVVAQVAAVAAEVGIQTAALPTGYRGPFLPADGSGLPRRADTGTAPQREEPARSQVLPAFKGLDWRNADRAGRLLVSVKPVADADLAERVGGLLAAAPGFSAVRPLGATGDVCAYEVEYEGELPRGMAVSQALSSVGASLVAGGDREFYLAIEGQLVG
ncbi:MAG: hypothetical protein M3Z13_04000 [Candidatus Dormibacteraeota bacterium]|nr:hypothetical protein [Candidatus Dormibacteraeota bacterium]